MKRKLTGLVLFFFFVVQAAFAQPSVVKINDETYATGIPTAEFRYAAAPASRGRQRQSNWCWAACIQMVFNYHGLNVTQEALVYKIYGRLVNAPATPQQIMQAVNGTIEDESGRLTQVRAWFGFRSARQILNELNRKQPMIVGLFPTGRRNGHAYVVTAAYYRLRADNTPTITHVVLRDPYPGKKSRVVYSWRRFLASRPQLIRIRVYKQAYAMSRQEAAEEHHFSRNGANAF